MGTANLNVWLRNQDCALLTDCWMTDLAIYTCNGKPLVDLYPELITQLKEKYAKPATVTDYSTYPVTDQDTQTLSIQVGTETAQVLTFGPATEQFEIYSQMKAFFTNVNVELIDDRISVSTIARGPSATLTIGGTSTLVWGPITNGSGWEIKVRDYQNARRINIFPPSGEHINHINMDVPPGCYKIWTRVCHGQNEETSVVMKILECHAEECANLLLPALKTCSAHVIHPLMDRVINEQFLHDNDERVIAFRALMYGANLGKGAIEAQLNDRMAEAVLKEDTVLQARIQAVLDVADLLPECA